MPENFSLSELMIRIHRYHRQLSELNARLVRGQKKILFLEMQRDQYEKNRDELNQQLLEAHLNAKDQETTLNKAEEALKKRLSQLNEAKNNKEYQSLSEQINIDRENNSLQADNVLELITLVEDLSQQVDQAGKEIDELNQKIQDVQKNFEKEKAVINQDLACFSEKLQEAEGELPKDFRGIYSHLKKNLGGEESLAPIIDDFFCGHCNQQIPTPMIAEVCGGKPVICRSCGRLLYTPEGFVFR